ncbi:MAG: SpoIVB peptidase S55 domain-containing protein, partial [Ruminococcus sp.]|nr:SpoIVB peptidase S55 domain-containing protein [Ruminococcus sp.]
YTSVVYCSVYCTSFQEITQEMSGSPIIQDGKLVGAVTHVCVFG